MCSFILSAASFFLTPVSRSSQTPVSSPHGGARPRQPQQQPPRRQSLVEQELEAARRAALAATRRRDCTDHAAPSRQEEEADLLGWSHQDHEIECEGQELYAHFFHERLRHEGLSEDAAKPALDVLHDHHGEGDQEEAREHVPESVRGICKMVGAPLQLN